MLAGEIGLMLLRLLVLLLVVVGVPLQVAATLAYPIHSHRTIPRDDGMCLHLLRHLRLAPLVKLFVIHAVLRIPSTARFTEIPFWRLGR